MKQTLTILLALFLFSCSKPQLIEPTINHQPQYEEVVKVTIGAHVWMHNYKLKYKRTGGWCDTLISDVDYTIQYNCYVSELNLPVTITNVEIYDKDTLALGININTSIYDYCIVNKCEGQVTLIPNLAL